MFPVIIWGSPYTDLKKFPHTHWLIRTLLVTGVGPSVNLWNFLWYSALWTLATLVFLDSQVYLLSSGNLPASPGFTLPAPELESSPKALTEGNHRAHLACFPSLKDHCLCCLWFSVLKIIVSCVLYSFLVVSGRRVNPVPFSPFCLEVEILKLNL